MNSNYKATQADFYHYMRGRLFKPVMFLEGACIVFIIASFLMNPYLASGISHVEAILLACIMLISLAKALSPSILLWRVGTCLYSVVLILIFALEVQDMAGRGDPFILPILISLWFYNAFVTPSKYDCLGIVCLTGTAASYISGQHLLQGVAPALFALLVFGVFVVAITLNRTMLAMMYSMFFMQDEFRRLAEIDPLTRIANRRSLFAHLDARLPDSKGLHWYWVLIDLDDFKQINDSHGHAAGDQVLVCFADLLERLSKPACPGRIGGEEFGLLLCRASLTEVGQLLEQLQTAAAEARPGGVSFSFSAGVAAFSSGLAVSEVLRAADQAMYEAKRLGKRQVVFAQNNAVTVPA
ncbi:GGDEF domain-containing protein [Aquitalea sp. LB_tupeE]|uniref:GGDEF domain-containing protein n=1 Tax=Aquitalea sp. LB_tupeE TaxID=2748078 RepID=UPI0015C1BD2D|nr:GGDEF domain-containing protein [Aquitalea sp. LB_tupeE]NWK78933.1 GGDEF domain-containing protein [Aquitalea sp. LB_tupeE]